MNHIDITPCQAAMLESMETALADIIADWLTDESTQLDMAIAGIQERDNEKDSDLHINMAASAMAVFLQGVKPVPHYSESQQ